MVLEDRTGAGAPRGEASAEDLVQVLFQEAPHGLVLQDQEGRIVAANPAAERILGLTLDQMQGRVSTDPRWRAVHEDGSPFPGEDHPSMETLRTGRAIQGAVMGIQVPGREAVTWLRVSTTPRVDPGGGVLEVWSTFTDVTEGIEAKLDLERTLEHLSLSHRAAQAGSWEWDQAGGDHRWYRSLWSLLGLEPEGGFRGAASYPAPSQEAWYRLIHPEDRERVRLQVEGAVARGEAMEAQWRLVRPGGEVRWMESRGQPQRDGAGRMLGYLGTITDITDLKRAEEEARANRAELEAALASLTDAVWIADAEGRFTTLNDAFATLHRFPDRASCARTLAEYPSILEVSYLDGTPIPLDQWVVPRALRGESGVNQEFRLRRRDTGETWVSSYSFAPIRNPEGRIVGCVATGRDATQAKEVERALRESVENFRAAFEASPDAVLVRQVGGRFLEVNQVALDRYGYSRSEFLAMAPEDLAPPELRDQVPAVVQLALSSGRAAEWVHQKKDGTRIPVELLLRPFTFGGLPCIYACARDISERKAAEEQRRHLEAQLHQAQKLESLGSLAGGVAHDINNVLGAIQALAEVNQRRSEPGTPLRRDMDTLVRACERGGRLVKGLLGFARQELSEARILDLNGVVQEVATLLGRTTLQKVDLRVDLDPTGCFVRGEAAALAHAVMNLCVNAVDAMPEAGTLTLRTRHQDARVVLEVEDTGTGMTPEVLSRVLEPFFTTKPQGKGTGLGLPIVYGTVKAHLGTLELSSQPGRGTLVRIQLPASPGAAAELPAGSSGAIGAPCRPLDLLVVDDDELIRLAMQTLLEALGHRATIVAGGEEALAALAGGLRPDAVILDMNMPGLDGAATLARLRVLDPALPVLLASGGADPRVQVLATQYPGVRLLPKPFSAGQVWQELCDLSQGAGKG